MEEFGTQQAPEFPQLPWGTAGKWDVRTNPRESEQLLVISGQKIVLQEWQEAAFQEHQETAQHSKDRLVHTAGTEQSRTRALTSMPRRDFL